MRFQRLSVVATLFLALTTPLLFAGVLIEETTQPLSGQGTATTVRIHLDQDRARIESEAGGRPHVIIYRADRQTMYMINPAEKSYREMTNQDLEKMGGQISQMQKMMEEKMKNMPPEQRQMMEQIMKQRMGGAGMPAAQQPQTVYQKVASGETVNQWTADKYEGLRAGRKEMEVWTTGWNEFGVTQSDFRVFQDLGEYFKKLSPQMNDDMFRIGSAQAESQQGYSGVPVRRIFYRNGSPYQKSEVTRVTRQDFERILFEPPDGFRKETMPAMPGAQ
jgi:hypothetical protein